MMYLKCVITVTCIHLLLVYSEIHGLKPDTYVDTPNKLSDGKGFELMDGDILEIKAAFQHQSAKIADLESMVHQQQADIDSLLAMAELYKKEKESANKANQQQTVRISSLETTVQQQSKHIASLEADKHFQNTRMNSLEITVQQLNSRILSLEAFTKHQENRIALLESTTQHQETINFDMKTRIQQQNTHIASMKATIQDGKEIISCAVVENCLGVLSGSIKGSTVNVNEPAKYNEYGRLVKVGTGGSNIVVPGKIESFGHSGNNTTDTKKEERPIRASSLQHVAFSTYLSNWTHYTGSTTIKFDGVIINDGDAYNVYTGIFTVPVSGVYFFSFSVFIHKGIARSRLMKDGVTVSSALAHTADPREETMATNSVITHASAGNSIWVELHDITDVTIVSSSVYRLVTFTGFKIY